MKWQSPGRHGNKKMFSVIVCEHKMTGEENAISDFYFFV
jgi:hypothetical protein